VVKKNTSARTTQPAAKRALARIAPAAAKASSSDTMLMVGGLALVILVLGDTVFLALSSRFLREAR
jgi:hypothetical protein